MGIGCHRSDPVVFFGFYGGINLLESLSLSVKAFLNDWNLISRFYAQKVESDLGRISSVDLESILVTCAFLFSIWLPSHMHPF